MSTERENLPSDPNLSEPRAPDRIALRLTKPHRLIARTLQEEELRKKSEYAYGRQVQIVDFHASKKQTRTALAILDRLFKALEAQEFEVILDAPAYGRAGTVARKGRDQCAVRVDEVHDQIAHEVTAKDKADQDRYGSKPRKWDSVPTGQFTLTPGGKVDLRSEDAFAACLSRAMAAIAEHIEESRKVREERESVQREEAHRQRLKDEEERRVKAFRESAQSLEQYRILVQYIEEVRRHGFIPRNQLREDQTLDQWLSWAESQAQAFHPLA